MTGNDFCRSNAHSASSPYLELSLQFHIWTLPVNFACQALPELHPLTLPVKLYLLTCHRCAPRHFHLLSVASRIKELIIKELYATLGMAGNASTHSTLPVKASLGLNDQTPGYCFYCISAKWRLTGRKLLKQFRNNSINSIKDNNKKLIIFVICLD